MTTTAPTTTDPHVLALAARILPLLPNIDRGSDRVYEWPDDEAEMHRRPGWLSWTERNEALALYRRQKLARAIAEDLARPLTRVRALHWSIEEVWTQAEGKRARQWCSHCSDFDYSIDQWTLWPCPTLLALDCTQEA